VQIRYLHEGIEEEADTSFDIPASVES